LIFINNTPIFYLARKVLYDSTIGLAFLFVIVTTFFVYIEFNVTWIMPFNGIVALFLSLVVVSLFAAKKDKVAAFMCSVLLSFFSMQRYPLTDANEPAGLTAMQVNLSTSLAAPHATISFTY
jgi:hypothetical protein